MTPTVFDYDPWYKKAEELLETTTVDDRISWYNHPCTKSLMNTLRGDMALGATVFVEGGYSSEDSADATAQKISLARGKILAMSDILDRITAMKSEGDEE